jgi:hypothetical protein
MIKGYNGSLGGAGEAQANRILIPISQSLGGAKKSKQQEGTKSEQRSFKRSSSHHLRRR